ncbi:MAG: type IV pilus assembly protein PilM [Patescibacteria group bacterium]
MAFGKNIKNVSTLGIDLGAAAIKAVELRNEDNHVRLITYGIAELPETAPERGAIQNKTEAVQHLRDLLQSAKTRATEVVASLPSLNVFSALIDLPAMPDKEIASAITWEAKKLLPLPVDKMSVDWHVIPEWMSPEKKTDEKQEKGKEVKKTMPIILTAAPKETINNYISIFKELDLTLIGLETEAAAFRRSLQPSNGDAFMVVDMGATTTNMIIFWHGVPILSRHTDVGGETIDRNIANTMNITAERAEQFKLSIGLPESGEYSHPASKAIKFVIDNMLTQELKRLIYAFKKMNRGSISEIIITGGCARMKNFPAYLQQVLGINTTIANPWQRISYPTDLEEELMNIAPKMSIAAGLALKRTGR